MDCTCTHYWEHAIQHCCGGLGIFFDGAYVRASIRAGVMGTQRRNVRA